jgi:hypothetical protein
LLHAAGAPLPGFAVDDATRLQLSDEFAAPQPLMRLRLSPPADAIATLGPSSVTLDALRSVYVSLPLSCGIVSTELM